MSETNGNIAAMREAAESLCAISEGDMGELRVLSKRLIDEDIYGGGLIDWMVSGIGNLKLALAAPARNCDVGTPAEQAERFHRYCRAHRTFFTECSASCPFTSAPDINHCQSGWAQLPYAPAAKEGGAL